MRTHAQLQLVTLFALASCASHAESSTTAAATPTPPPLTSCETRNATIEGTNVIVEAGVDAKPMRIIVDASDTSTRARAYDAAVRIYGEPHPDPRTKQVPFKWGLVQITDLCGRLVEPQASPKGR